MDKIEMLIEKLAKTNDGTILSKLNEMGVSVTFLPEGIRWSYSEN